MRSMPSVSSSSASSANMSSTNSSGSATEGSATPFQNILDQQSQASRASSGDSATDSAGSQGNSRNARIGTNGTKNTAATSSAASASDASDAKNTQASKSKSDKDGTQDPTSVASVGVPVATPHAGALPVANGAWLAGEAGSAAVVAASQAAAAQDKAVTTPSPGSTAVNAASVTTGNAKPGVRDLPFNAQSGATTSSDGTAGPDAPDSPGSQAKFGDPATTIADAVARSVAKDESTNPSPGPNFGHLSASLAAVGDAAQLQASNGPSATGSATAPITASPANGSNSISAPVGSSQFAAETATKVLYFAQNNIQTAQLSLNPAHLGPLDVQIRLNGDQVSLALVAGHADTRHAIEAGLPKLREMFSEQGINLGDLSVGARAFSNGGGAQQQYSSSQSHGLKPAATTANEAIAGAVVGSSHSLQLVDTFA